MSEIYDKNLAALKDLLPEVAKWIDDGPPVDWLRADGDQLYMMNGSQWVPVYNEKDQKADIAEIEGSVKCHKENVTVMLGIGLGHGLARICEKAEKGHHVVAVEPVPWLWRQVFERYDLSKAINDRLLLVAKDKEAVDQWVASLETLKVVQDWGLLVERVGRTRHEYQPLVEHTLECLNQVQCNNGTVVSAGKKIADNDIATLPWVIRHRGVAELVNLFAGKPAVVVSTGPSLARNIHVLKAIHDAGTAVIVAVGQALRPLLAYDIRPDFICTVDFGEVNMTHFAGLCDETVPLVTINKAYAPLLKAYRGPKFISASAQPEQYESAHGVLRDCGELAQGGSVAHMTYALAVNLGCQPIAFVGQDLALGEASHFALADSAGCCEVQDGQIRWKVNDPRSKTLHGRDDLGMGPAQQVPGWWGEPALTNTGLLSFITAMERLVADTKVSVYNCTEGGAHIRGTRRLFLQEYANRFCTAVVDKSVLTPLLTPRADADQRVADCLPLLCQDIVDLRAMIRNCERGLDTALKMRNTHNVGKLKKLMADNFKYSNAAHATAKRMPTVAVTIYWASRQIQTRELNVDEKPDHLLDDRKDLLIRLDRNELILKACRDAGRDLLKTYEEVERLMTDHIAGNGRLDPTGETEAASIDDWQQYMDVGNWARPLLEARRIYHCTELSSPKNIQANKIMQKAYIIRADKIQVAREIQAADREAGRNKLPEYMDLVGDAKQLGLDKKYEEAVAVCRRAIDLLPEKENARWGLATALYFMERYDEAIAAYGWLVKNFPGVKRYQQEFAAVLQEKVEKGN